MTHYVIIDPNRQPPQIRCLHCGFAQDLQLPMAIDDLMNMSEKIDAEHKKCKQATSSRGTN
jgi:hypothetical protein